MTKKRICEAILIVAIIAIATGGYYSVYKAAFVDTASNVVVPLLWFGMLTATVAVMGVLNKEKITKTIAALSASIPSIFFAPEIIHIILLGLSTGLFYVGIDHVSRDLNERKKVRTGTSLGAGMTKIIVAVALAISSQYFFHVQEKTLDEVIPQVTDIPGAERIIDAVVAIAQPNIKEGSQMTVNEFIVQSQEEAVASIAVPQGAEEIVEQIMSQSNQSDASANEIKQRLEEQTGQEVSGDETVTEIITKITNQRVRSLVGTDDESAQKITQTTALVFSIVLFVTVLSIGSFVRPIIVWIGMLIFTLLHWTKVVNIAKEQQEVEVVK